MYTTIYTLDDFILTGNYTICVMLAVTKTATFSAMSSANSVLIQGKASLFI